MLMMHAFGAALYPKADGYDADDVRLYCRMAPQNMKRLLYGPKINRETCCCRAASS